MEPPICKFPYHLLPFQAVEGGADLCQVAGGAHQEVGAEWEGGPIENLQPHFEQLGERGILYTYDRYAVFLTNQGRYKILIS